MGLTTGFWSPYVFVPQAKMSAKAALDAMTAMPLRMVECLFMGPPKHKKFLSETCRFDVKASMAIAAIDRVAWQPYCRGER